MEVQFTNDKFYGFFDKKFIYKLQLFALFSLGITLLISFFKYENLFYFVIFIFLLHLIIFLRTRNFIYIIFALIFAMFFDIDNVFTFGGKFYLRIWYFIPLVFISWKSISFLQKNSLLNIKINAFPLFFLFSLLYFSTASLLLTGNKIEAVMFFSKLLFFYVPIIFIFVLELRKEYLPYVILYFIFMIFWVSLFGIAQFISAYYGLLYFQYEYDLRPQGFFSETSWMGIASTFGIIFSLLSYSITQRKKYLFLTIPMFVIFVLSATRGAYLSMGIAIPALFISGTSKEKKGMAALLFLLFFTILILKLTLGELYNLITYISMRLFSIQDISALGRLEGYRLNLKYISKNLLTGLGFGFNEVIRGSGSIIGAKSFNIFFAVLNSIGIFGFIAFLCGLLNFLIKYLISAIKCKIKNCKIILVHGFLGSIVWLIYSQNAPLHLYPFGWLVLGLVISIYANVNYRTCEFYAYCKLER